jgi:hypothetical protein
MKRIAWLLLATAGAAPAAPRPNVELACVAHGMGPLLDCTVRVAAAGAPLADAKVTLGASMPSMPMAHTVKPVVAVPTGRPGEFRGTLQLEMNGDWAVHVDLAGPVRDRVVRVLAVDECEGDRRCPVAPARPAARKP